WSAGPYTRGGSGNRPSTNPAHRTARTVTVRAELSFFVVPLLAHEARLSYGRSGIQLQQIAGLLVAGGRAAVFAGRHAGQREQLPPAERRPRPLELLADRLVVLLGVQ